MSVDILRDWSRVEATVGMIRDIAASPNLGKQRTTAEALSLSPIIEILITDFKAALQPYLGEKTTSYYAADLTITSEIQRIAESGDTDTTKAHSMGEKAIADTLSKAYRKAAKPAFWSRLPDSKGSFTPKARTKLDVKLAGFAADWALENPDNVEKNPFMAKLEFIRLGLINPLIWNSDKVSVQIPIKTPFTDAVKYSLANIFLGGGAAPFTRLATYTEGEPLHIDTNYHFSWR